MRHLLLVSMVLSGGISSVSAERAPVMRHIDLPHSYYFREMYLPQLTSGPSSAAFSPDGSELIYSQAGYLWRQRIGDTEAVQLTQGAGYHYQPDWSADGRYLVYVKRDGDFSEIWRLDLHSGTELQLTRDQAVALEPRLSPDGTQLAYVSTKNTGHFNIWLAQLNPQGLVATAPFLPERQSKIDRYYYSSWDHRIHPSWSADGKSLYFVSNPEMAWGSGDIWRSAVDAPEKTELVLREETTWAANPELNPDGKRLLYSSYQGRQWHQLWLTTPKGDNPLPLTFGDFDRTAARWSKDGRQILYISNEQGNTSLWVQQVVGGAKREIKADKKRWLNAVHQVDIQITVQGKANSARLMLTGADGRHYAPQQSWVQADDGFQAGQQDHENHYFYCDSKCSLLLPAGEYQLRAQHGFAHQLIQQKLVVPAKSSSHQLHFQSSALPEKFGTHLSADMHVHMNYGGHYKHQLASLAQQAKAEDLDIIYNLIVNKEQRIPDIELFSTTPYQSGDVTIFQGQEYHTSFWGHLGLLHLNDHLITPDFASYRHTALASPYPHNGVITDLTHQQQGLVGYVHPFDWRIEPDKEKTLSHQLPADVIMGKTDYVEVVSFADHLATAEVWHRFLNLGFAVAAGAGTDAMANYASLRGPVGLNRLFLRTADRSDKALSQAIKSGAGFVSNGPLLGLKVNDKLPGERLKLKAGQSVTLDLAVRSNLQLDHIELLHNGVVTRLNKNSLNTLDQQLTLDIQRSGWLLLRAYHSSSDPLLQDLYAYATTNPVWLDVEGSSASSPEDARYFVRWLERTLEAVQQRRTDFNTEQEFADTIAYLQQALAKYKDLTDE